MVPTNKYSDWVLFCNYTLYIAIIYPFINYSRFYALVLCHILWCIIYISDMISLISHCKWLIIDFIDIVTELPVKGEKQIYIVVNEKFDKENLAV